MPLKIVVGGVEKDSVRADVIVSGVTKAVRRIEVWTGSAWKVGHSFLSPLTVMASPPSLYKSVQGLPSPATVTTSGVTAIPAGGQGPYSYAWSIVAGTGIAILAPSFATAAFQATIPVGIKTGTAQCVVSDSIGSTPATITVPLTFENLGENP